MTYQAVAINLNSYVYRNGKKVCDDIADCGHNHRTIAAAEACLIRIWKRGSTLWCDAEIRDSHGNPIGDELLSPYPFWPKK